MTWCDISIAGASIEYLPSLQFVSFIIIGLFSPSDDNEYVAIKTIHKQLDDNADGSVDFSESAEVSVVLVHTLACIPVWRVQDMNKG